MFQEFIELPSFSALTATAYTRRRVVRPAGTA